MINVLEISVIFNPFVRFSFFPYLRRSLALGNIFVNCGQSSVLNSKYLTVLISHLFVATHNKANGYKLKLTKSGKIDYVID